MDALGAAGLEAATLDDGLVDGSGAADVHDVANYVLSLSGDPHNPIMASAGRTTVATRCARAASNSSSSVSANYVKYVWASMTKSTGSPGSNRKAYMNTVGAVSRGINNIWIDPRLDTVNYTSSDFPLSWKSYTDAKEFEVLLYNKDNISTPFYSTIVTKLKIAVPDLVVAGKIKPGNSYYWTVAIKGEENDDLKVLSYVSKADFDKFLATLTGTTSFEAPAEQAFRLGFMLEDAHYLSEAYRYYSKAATLDSNNVLYRSTLMSFKKDYEIK